MPTHSKDLAEDRTLKEDQVLAEVFSTIDVAKAYLRYRHSGTWGKFFYTHNEEGIQQAAEYITQVVDAINAIRNLALVHQQGINRAAELYEQLAFPVVTKESWGKG